MIKEEEIKRVNYFEGQHLRDEDFQDDQEYHITMRHLHNKWLHTWGICYGLEVNKETDRRVKIYEGMAMDKDGQEIIVPEEGLEVDVPLRVNSVSGEFYLTLKYPDNSSGVETSDVCAKEKTRITEKAQSNLEKVSEFVNDGSKIPLAKIRLENCVIKDDIDTSIRNFAGYAELGCVRKVGDTMMGPLIINRAPDSDEEINSLENIESIKKINLHLVASKDNDGPYISTNKDTISLWSLKKDEPDDFANLHVKDIYADGNVGIGTTNLSGRLTINGIVQSQQGVLTFFSQDADIEYDGGSDGLFIFKDTGGKTAFMGGDIGIGRTNPTAKLHVEGDFRAEGNMRLGGKLYVGNRIILRNYHTVWLFSYDNTDTSEVNLGSPKNFYAFVVMTGCDPNHNFDQGDAFALDIFKVDGNKTSPWLSGGEHWGEYGSDNNVYAQSYSGFGQWILFRARSVQDAYLHGIGIVFYE